MVKQTLPCAEKNCNSQMTLIENHDNTLGYSCLAKPSEHNFRYNLIRKKWKKIIFKTKLIVHYNKDPCEEYLIKSSNVIAKPKKIVVDTVLELKNKSNLTEINGIGSKRAKELEIAGVKNISDLANCSSKALSEKSGIPIVQISNWIIEANKLTEKAIKLYS